MQWYEDEVRALEISNAKRLDTFRPPVFYGSSSFRLWNTLSADFAPGVVNLGFGGSTLQACDYFFERLVPPVHPRSILVYAGDNDLGDGRTLDESFSSFQSLAGKVRAKLGTIPFGFISIKPSPARYAIIDRIRLFNDAVRRDIETRERGYYVDVFPIMLDKSGKPNVNYFGEDGLHLNREGYRLWGESLKPYYNRIFTE